MANSLFLVLISNGLLIALVGAHGGTYYLAPFLNRTQNHSKTVVCDNESEFQCIKDNKCISLSQVCDFVRDCSDGQDETKCGNCDFSQLPANCGLRFQPAGPFSWFRREQVAGLDDEEPAERRFYMHTGLDVTKREYLDRLHNNWHLTYRPKITFPQLRPTNNDKCQFSLQLRVTQHEDPELASATMAKKHQLAPSWPQVFMMLVQPRRSESLEERDGFVEGHKAFNLNVMSESKREGLGQWVSYTVPLGARRTVWSLEIVVEAKISSYLVQVTDFKFTNCAPTTSGMKEEEKEKEKEVVATERPLYSTAACLPGQFKCSLSGLCIDGSLVCDYGYDCGQDDASDEEQCDNYQGRCDFEQPDLCGWLPGLEQDSWLWVAANEPTINGVHLSRPKVDHTYRGELMENSDESGHYMLLNLNKLDQTSMLSLAGPRVSLRDNARDCHFRFWFHGARSLDDQLTMSPAYLSVGSQRVPASRLFSRPTSTSEGSSRRRLNGGLRTSNADWQRMEVELLSRSVFGGGSSGETGGGTNSSPIEALELSFGHLLKDLELFKSRSGHLALDDFSFSPGCELHQNFRTKENSTLGCPNGHFQCLVPAPVTGARCLAPMSYCDFKNDCGLAHPYDLLASDEQLCPHECHFRFAENCHLEVMDGLERRRAGELRDEEPVNEALSWSMVQQSTSGAALTEPGHLTISSRAHSYLNEWLRQAVKTGAAGVINRRLKSLEFRLPIFSQSHANCSLELNYKWWQNSEGLRLDWFLENQELAYRHLVKRMQPSSGDTRSSRSETINFGLGHQPTRFRLIGEVAFVNGLADLKAQTGAISIYSYRFLGCSFHQGLATMSHELKPAPKVEDENNSDGEYGDLSDSGDPSDYLDYSEPRVSTRSPTTKARCSKNEFQCQEPLVCIPRHQVCDMQLDCQLGEDERDCSHQLRWDFDQEEDASKSWFLLGDDTNTRLESILGGGDASLLLRQDNDAGPPYDHTKSNKLGSYLVLSPHHRLNSPRIAWRNSAAGCQLVFYLYDYEGRQAADDSAQRASLRVTKLVGAARRQEHIYATTLDGRDDQWRRHSVEIRTGGDETFELLFEWLLKGEGSSRLLALDDISLGENCQLDSGGGLVDDSQPLFSANEEEEEASGLSWLVLVVMLLALGTMAALLSRSAQSSRQTSTHAMAQAQQRWQQFSLAQLDLVRLVRHETNASLRQYRAQVS